MGVRFVKYIVVVIILIFINYFFVYKERKLHRIDNNNNNDQIILKNNSIGGSRYLVSYVMYAPILFRKNEKVYQTCRENVDIFISRAVVSSNNVEYVFLLAGDTPKTRKLKDVSLLKNVKVLNVKNDGVDILSHLKFLKTIKDAHFDFFILLNCGARGPYFIDNKINNVLPSISWISQFTSKLKDDIALVGPTISLEISPHVQSYALAFTKNSSQIIIDYWNQFEDKIPPIGHDYNSEERMKNIAKLEVSLSQHIINSGLNIASFDTRYEKINFKQNGMHNSINNNENNLNPTRCDIHSKNSIGCDGLEPCEVLFVKYGGEIIQNNAVPIITKERLNEEDKLALEKKSKMCNNFIGSKYRPNWNPKKLINDISVFTTVDHLVGDIDLVIMVRAYSDFINQLLSMLFNIEACSTNIKVQVIIIPTDEKSVIDIKYAIVKQWYSTLVTHHIRVSLIEFPSWVYQTYGNYIDTLCTEFWKQQALQQFHVGFIGRFCKVNSPLHYLLVDIGLEYVKTNLYSYSYWIIITNADNYYFPQFFDHLMKWKNSSVDVLMTNMIHNGNLFPTLFKKSKTDLGSYAIKSNFLKKTNITFLNSLPFRSNPIHYHEADGYFLEKLISLNANTHKEDSYSFAHNR